MAESSADPRPRRRTLREAFWVTALATAVTAWVWWPAVKGLRTQVPVDLGDPLYFAWQLAWVSHAAAGRADLWTTNAFSGAPDSLAFTDAVLGYAPLGLAAGALTADSQSAALAQLNLALLLSTVVAFVGAYALARALGSRALGGLVAGAGFAFAPWRLAQVVHINVFSVGGMALALALLARGHGWSFTRGHQPQRASVGWTLAGWAVACWQLSISLAIGVPFAYVLLIVATVALVGWLRAGRPALGVAATGRRMVIADVVGAVSLLAVTASIVSVFLRVLQAHPEASRTAGQLELFSPPLTGLLTAPATSRWWGERQLGWRAELSWAPEMAVLPGFVLIALALAGLFSSSWPRRWRITLGGAAVVLTVLTLGTTVAGGRYTYVPLFEHLPGWNGLRTPGRLIIWVTLVLCVLAAGAVDCWARRARVRIRPRREVHPRPLLAYLAVGLLPLLVVLEGRGTVPFWDVARAPVTLADLPQPVLVLPTSQIADYHIMFWSTDRWPRMANGGSGFEPDFQVAMRKDAEMFPSAQAVAALRGRGVATVVVVRSRAGGTVWEQAADAPLPPDVERTDLGDAVVFDLR